MFIKYVLCILRSYISNTNITALQYIFIRIVLSKYIDYHYFRFFAYACRSTSILSDERNITYIEKLYYCFRFTKSKINRYIRKTVISEIQFDKRLIM